jgi:hypothetical protein
MAPATADGVGVIPDVTTDASDITVVNMEVAVERVTALGHKISDAFVIAK